MRCFPLLLPVMLCACGGMQYTVDDGRRLDDATLARIRAYGQGSVALQTAVSRAATKPARCEKAWALPFAVATSDQLAEDDRVAWVRVLRVDERLTVVAASPESGLTLGDKLVDVAGYHSDLGQRMLKALEERREDGRPFRVKTAAGRSVTISPLQVCRGRSVIALPSSPESQSYHWIQVVHPLAIFNEPLSADEALWVVLWGQGLSEEGGMRMKAYKYGLAPLRALLNVAAVVSGAGAASKAGESAAGAVIAKSVVTSVAVDAAKDQTLAAMSAASQHRASLEGVEWAAGTAFDEADTWAFARMVELGADPLAAFTLHRKLARRGLVRNAFVLDMERLPAMQSLAEASHLGPSVTSILTGEEPANLTARPASASPLVSAAFRTPTELALEDMPQAAPVGLPTESKTLSSLLAQPVDAMPQQNHP